MASQESAHDGLTVAVLESTYRTAEEQIREALRLLDYSPQGKKIFLKPNVVTYPRWLPLGGVPRAVITDVRFLEALLRVFDGYEVVIGEGALATRVSTDEVLEKAGVVALARRYGAQLVDLNYVERIEVPWAYGTLRLPALLQTHEYINVPKLKTHVQTGVSLACKNQKGLLASADKIRFHRNLNLHDAIRALADAVQPQLTILDGILGMEGAGPTLGRSRRSNVIVAGRDTRAVDVACCDLMSIPLELVKHLDRVPYRTVGNTDKKIRPRFHPTTETVIANIHFHAVEGTCSRCLQSAHDGLDVFWRSPYHIMRCTWSGILNRTDVITGQGHEIPPTARGRLVGYGDCTRELAEKHGFLWIPGCPPTPEAHLRMY